MKKRAVVLSLSIILAIILFAVSTYMQRKLINYEPKTDCLFVNEDIQANEKLTKEKFTKGQIDISQVAMVKIISDYSEIDGLYAKDNIYKGQIAIKDSFDTKEKLSIYEVENGKEKVSIKIKGAENGVSYSVKPGSKVNVYITLHQDLSKGFLEENERLKIGDEEYGYEIIKVLDSKTVIECFDAEGTRIKDSETNVIDTIILALDENEAKQINLLRDIGVFNITGVNGDEA